MTIDIVGLLIAVIVLIVAFWLVRMIPHPVAQQIATIVLVLIAVIWVIGILTGRQLVHFR